MFKPHDHPIDPYKPTEFRCPVSQGSGENRRRNLNFRNDVPEVGVVVSTSGLSQNVRALELYESLKFQTNKFVNGFFANFLVFQILYPPANRCKKTTSESTDSD